MKEVKEKYQEQMAKRLSLSSLKAPTSRGKMYSKVTNHQSLKKALFFYLSVCLLFLCGCGGYCMSLCVLYMCGSLQRPEEGSGSSRMGITSSCECPCERWVLCKYSECTCLLNHPSSLHSLILY